MENISTTYPKARKNHTCQGWRQILYYDPDRNVGHKCKGIKKGDEYIRQVNKSNDEVYTWKSCEPCNRVICDNGLVEEM